MDVIGRLWIKYGAIFAVALLVSGLFAGYLVGYYVGTASRPASKTLLMDAAGTLEVPFNGIVRQVLVPEYPNLAYNYIFEGSRLAVNEIVVANKSFDLFASADYRIIPQQLIPAHASWYVIFASNSMAVVYTNHSRYSGEMNSENWYRIITRPGVVVGVSNKETDPSGSQAIFMLELAGLDYFQNSSYLYDQLYVAKANAKELVIVPTETYLDAQLEAGSIDYVLTYSSEAISHKLLFVDPGPRVSLGNLTLADWYDKVNTTIRNTLVTGAPILYDLTIPSNSPNPEMGTAFIQALFSPMGQRILTESGLKPLNPVYVYNSKTVPTPVMEAITQNGITIKEIT